MLASDSAMMIAYRRASKGHSCELFCRVSDKQVGKKAKSDHRWIHKCVNVMVGAKFCPLINSLRQIVDWDADTANVYDGNFQRMFADCADANKNGACSFRLGRQGRLF